MPELQRCTLQTYGNQKLDSTRAVAHGNLHGRRIEVIWQLGMQDHRLQCMEVAQ